MKKYQIIYADPPWEYKESGSGNRVVSSKYPTMNIEEIKKLNVMDISDEKSILFLWATFPRLPQCLEVIKAWGFEYYGLAFDWVKTSKDGQPSWGMGYYTRQNTEVCLIGVKPKPHRFKPLVRNVLSVVHSQRLSHSEKPAIFRKKIVEIIGDVSRIELFARKPEDMFNESYQGWDVWGNEVKSNIEL